MTVTVSPPPGRRCRRRPEWATSRPRGWPAPGHGVPLDQDRGTVVRAPSRLPAPRHDEVAGRTDRYRRPVIGSQTTDLELGSGRARRRESAGKDGSVTRPGNHEVAVGIRIDIDRASGPRVDRELGAERHSHRVKSPRADAVQARRGLAAPPGNDERAIECARNPVGGRQPSPELIGNSDPKGAPEAPKIRPSTRASTACSLHTTTKLPAPSTSTDVNGKAETGSVLMGMAPVTGLPEASYTRANTSSNPIHVTTNPPRAPSRRTGVRPPPMSIRNSSPIGAPAASKRRPKTPESCRPGSLPHQARSSRHRPTRPIRSSACRGDVH